ncbi:hypothetical protein K0M31_006097 [Melipona bicolor]|uniref:Uncharacterized protein n=1 Tax=Melipona bicolor TaxID=60889 RepID=A0AA40KLF0_9HYME|nr:hypothetical protein K0M31_006097 [Melipona bicolor]
MAREATTRLQQGEEARQRDEEEHLGGWLGLSGTSVKRHEPSSIRKHCGCCGTLPSVCPSCSPAVRSTDFRNNNRQARNTPPPPCRRLIVASSAPPSPPPLLPPFTCDQPTDFMVNFLIYLSLFSDLWNFEFKFVRKIVLLPICTLA